MEENFKYEIELGEKASSQDAYNISSDLPEQKLTVNTEMLDNYTEMIKRINSKVSACVVCGVQGVQLIRVNKLNKKLGYICKLCLIRLHKD